MNIEKLLERLIPFDNIYSKEKFLSALTPELLEILKEKINNDPNWRYKAEHEQVYFIIDDDRWKQNKIRHFNAHVNITLIGPNEIPVISIYYLSKTKST